MQPRRSSRRLDVFGDSWSRAPKGATVFALLSEHCGNRCRGALSEAGRRCRENLRRAAAHVQTHSIAAMEKERAGQKSTAWPIPAYMNQA